MNKNEAVELLKKGKVGIFPTDTAFGIGCRMDFEESVKRIFDIRNRPFEKALLILVSSIEMAEEYVQIPDEVRKKMIDSYWPGPLTLILKCKTQKVPSIVRADGLTLAVRFPKNKELIEIIDSIACPIVAPSANFSGEKTPFTPKELNPEFVKLVDFVLPGECTMREVSTIVDCTSSPWKIERQGAVHIPI